MRRKSTNLHPKLLRFHALPVSSSSMTTLTSLPRTIFLATTRKIACMVLVLCYLNVKFDDVKGCCSCLEETCHRPPREETERLQRWGEKERRQSTVGHSWQTNTTHLCCNQFQSSQREKARCLPGMWVIYVPSPRAGMDSDRTHGFCLICLIHILA